MSRYDVFMRDWLRVFPRNQIHIHRLEDWEQDCPSLLTEVIAFLELGKRMVEPLTSIKWTGGNVCQTILQFPQSWDDYEMYADNTGMRA